MCTDEHTRRTGRLKLSQARSAVCAAGTTSRRGGHPETAMPLLPGLLALFRTSSVQVSRVGARVLLDLRTWRAASTGAPGLLLAARPRLVGTVSRLQDDLDDQLFDVALKAALLRRDGPVDFCARSARVRLVFSEVSPGFQHAARVRAGVLVRARHEARERKAHAQVLGNQSAQRASVHRRRICHVAAGAGPLLNVANEKGIATKNVYY